MIRLPRTTSRFAKSLSTSAIRSAKLIDSSTSVSVDFARTLPPAPPLVPRPTGTNFTPNRPLRPLPPIASGNPHEFDDFVIRTLASSHIQSTFPDLSTLLKQLHDNQARVLPGEQLKSEPTPTQCRKVKTDSEEDGVEGVGKAGYQSGLVVVAHVIDKEVFLCSGFAVGTSDPAPGQGTKILTCCHTFQSAAKRLKSSTTTPSASFIFSSSGHLFPVTSVLSSLPHVDICLLEISPEPIRNPSHRPLSSSDSASPSQGVVPTFKTLPVSPFPAVVGTRVASLVFRNPSTLPSAAVPDWVYGRITEYSDFAGRTAETGTYDELANMHVSTIPTNGSSGGPVVDVESGAVVGVIRGSMSRYGDRGARGLSAPAEKIFEMFELPGFTSRSKGKEQPPKDAVDFLEQEEKERRK